MTSEGQGRGRRTTVKDYLNEPVDYGGEIVTRGEMIRDLESMARQVAPGDPVRQEGLVNAYLMGDESHQAAAHAARRVAFASAGRPSLPRRQPPGTTQDYLSEPVNYGGEVTTRAYMLGDLRRIAASRYPNDPKRQQAVLNSYLATASSADTVELFEVTNDRSYEPPQVFDNRKDAEFYARTLNDRHTNAHARVVPVRGSYRNRGYKRSRPGTTSGQVSARRPYTRRRRR